MYIYFLIYKHIYTCIRTFMHVCSYNIVRSMGTCR